SGEYTLAVATTSLAPAMYTVAITATDSGSETVMMNATVTITNVAPTITAAAFPPSSVQSGSMVTLDVTVSDLNSSMTTNDIANVTANITALGGSSAVGITFVSQPSATSATYSLTFATTGAAAQVHNITVTARDMANAMD